MICQFCGERFHILDIGAYVQHLIEHHWPILVKVREWIEAGRPDED